VRDTSGPETDPLEAFAGYLLALGLSPRTVPVYERALERFIVFATDEGFDPLEANVFDLSGYAQTLPNTSASKRQHRVALRHWFEWQGRTDAPLKAIRVPPKKRGVSRALEPDQAIELARTASGWWPEGAAVLLGLYRG
jgi:site-specific recombinase XerD